MKSQVLKLLLLARPMNTAALWRDALQQLESADSVPTSEELERQSPATPAAAHSASQAVLVAIDAVVPHLPEYSSLHPQLEALFECCQIEYPRETEQMVRIWLQRGASTTTAFRTWLHRWIRTKKPYDSRHNDDSSEDSDQRQRRQQQQRWHHALCAAAEAEERVELKRALVQLMHELEPWSGDGNSEKLLTDSQQQLQESFASVDALLDFFWDHAHELAPFSLLCAAKLHALVKKQATTTTGSVDRFLQLTDGVLVRLRWGKLLKPVCFEGLLSHCFALQVFHPSVDPETFTVHDALQLQVTTMSWKERNLLLERLDGAKERLQDARTSNAAHFFNSSPASTSSWTASAGAHGQAFLALLRNEQQVVLLDLERDLEDAPPRLFPHILLSFGVIVSALLRSSEISQSSGEAGVLPSALKSLVALFQLRADCGSCFQLAALVVELRLPQHPIWNRAPSLFVEAAESLNEALAMETDAEKRWVLTMTLQQLLFECESGVVRDSLAVLASFLPARLLRLARMRLATE